MVALAAALLRRRHGPAGDSQHEDLNQQLQRERSRADELQQRLQALAAKAAQPAARRVALSQGSNSKTQGSDAQQHSGPPEVPVFQFRPIGVLRSCFTTRCMSRSPPLRIAPSGVQHQHRADVQLTRLAWSTGRGLRCRNGTPRQPLLVPSARSRLVLLSDVPDAALEGLHEWSHAWILYVFHENTGASRSSCQSWRPARQRTQPCGPGRACCDR